MRIKLSIIVPAFNIDPYIGETLQSLIDIRFSQPYEIIVVNDGSTDRTEEVVKEYQKRYEGIKLRSIQNGGVSRARNIGLEMASGDYIAFVDGDDRVSTDFFEIAVQRMETGHYSFVQSNYIILSDDGVTEKKLVNTETALMDSDVILRAFICKGRCIYNAVWGKVFHAEILQDIRFDEKIKISEDRKFVFDVIERSEKVLLIPHMGYGYRKRETSAMNSTSTVKRYDDNLKVLAYMEERVKLPDVLNSIEGKKISVLITLYSACENNPEHKTEYYNAFKQTSIHKAWRNISWKEMIKAVVMKISRQVFDQLFLKDR